MHVTEGCRKVNIRQGCKRPQEQQVHTVIQTFSSGPIHRACGHSAGGSCPGNHHLSTLANPRDNDRHSPHLGEVVQGLPQSQHLSAGHEGFLWAFQHLLQLHLGEQQAVGRARRSAQLRGAPCVLASSRVGPHGGPAPPEQPQHTPRPQRAERPRMRLPWPCPRAARCLCASVSPHRANARGALLHSSVSTLLTHVSLLTPLLPQRLKRHRVRLPVWLRLHALPSTWLSFPVCPTQWGLLETDPESDSESRKEAWQGEKVA